MKLSRRFPFRTRKLTCSALKLTGISLLFFCAYTIGFWMLVSAKLATIVTSEKGVAGTTVFVNTRKEVLNAAWNQVVSQVVLQSEQKTPQNRLTLSNARDVQIVSARLIHPSLDALRAISTEGNIIDVRLVGSTHDVVKPLESVMPNLTCLWLADVNVSDADLYRLISAGREIKDLCLENIATKQGNFLAHVERLTDLRRLSLNKLSVFEPKRFTANLASCLQAQPNLRELVVWSSDVDGSFLSCLPQLPRLQALTLIDTRATDKDLLNLSLCYSLKSINLERITISNEVLHTFAQLNGLEQIAVSRNCCSPDAIASLRKERPDLSITFLGSSN